MFLPAEKDSDGRFYRVSAWLLTRSVSRPAALQSFAQGSQSLLTMPTLDGASSPLYVTSGAVFALRVLRPRFHEFRELHSRPRALKVGKWSASEWAQLFHNEKCDCGLHREIIRDLVLSEGHAPCWIKEIPLQTEGITKGIACALRENSCLATNHEHRLNLSSRCQVCKPGNYLLKTTVNE